MPDRHSLLVACTLGALLSVPATADVLVVDPSDPTAFPDIQAAVDAAVPGDVVTVHAGIYGPVVVTTDDLTIEEAEPDSDPVVDAQGGLFAFQIDASEVTVRGLEARNAVGPSPFEGEGFLILGGTENRLVDCVATNNNSGGFTVVGGKGHVIEGSLATGNRFGFALSVLVGQFFPGAPEPTVRDTTLRDNIATGNLLDGFLTFEAGEGNLFERNLASHNGRTGFFLGASRGLAIVGNEIRDNGIDGINLSSVTGTLLKENAVSRHRRHGIALRQVTGCRFDENLVEQSGANGFSLDDFALFGGPGPSTGNSFRRNHVTSNGGFGFFIARTSSPNHFEDNVCADNAAGGDTLAGVETDTRRRACSCTSER